MRSFYACFISSNVLNKVRAMQIGIVGLPFSGKTTLFQTFTRSALDDAVKHKQQTHQAMVKVPDKRVDKLAEYFSPKKLVYTSIDFVDVVGLNRDDRNSAHFTSGFLASVKTNDALVHVVRAFDDPLYPHPEGSIDPSRDVNILETEFILSDLETVENRIGKLRKQAQKLHDDQTKLELSVMEKCHVALENLQPIRTLKLNVQEEKAVRGFQLLSQKPVLAVLNLGESELGTRDALIADLETQYADKGYSFDAFSGKIEMEMAQLSDEDAQMFMEEYGITDSALDRIIGSAYGMLGLISFLTFGDDECRAWTIKKGLNAQMAAGAIHTDLMNRFIRAEVVHFEDFVKHESIVACKEHGAWRLEGKEYVVLDGDMLTIRNG
jgi:ribosome-binding ATPase